MQQATRVIAWCLALLLLGIESLSAQLDRLPSRSELDSLVRPKLSTLANRGIAAKAPTLALGEVDDTEIVKAEFTLRNTTSSPVVITQLRSTCSCLKVLTRPSALRPGESLAVEVEFNPKGRSCKFSLDVFVYTTLDDKYPTERLTLTGSVRSTNRFSHLSQRAGALYMSRKSVVLDGVKMGTTRRETILVANGSESSITLKSEPLIEGLEVRLTPTTLKPGEEGVIEISYTARKAINDDIETLIIIDGCGGRPTERVIKVMIKR